MQKRFMNHRITTSRQDDRLDAHELLETLDFRRRNQNFAVPFSAGLEVFDRDRPTADHK